MDITITINGEASEQALSELIQQFLTSTKAEQPAPVQAFMAPAPAGAAPAQAPIPEPPMPQPIPAPTAPAPVAMPAGPGGAMAAYTPAPVAPGPAPVADGPTYTLNDLARAASVLRDAGKLPELQGLLQQMGVASMAQLPPARYGEFATALRQMGAQI